MHFFYREWHTSLSRHAIGWRANQPMHQNSRRRYLATGEISCWWRTISTCCRLSWIWWQEKGYHLALFVFSDFDLSHFGWSEIVTKYWHNGLLFVFCWTVDLAVNWQFFIIFVCSGRFGLGENGDSVLDAWLVSRGRLHTHGSSAFNPCQFISKMTLQCATLGTKMDTLVGKIPVPVTLKMLDKLWSGSMT